MQCTINFGGFYETLHDSKCEDMVHDIFREENGDLPESFHELDIDWKKIHDAFAVFYMDNLATYIKNELGIGITYENLKIESPKEYNFKTDVFLVDIPDAQVNAINAKLAETKDFKSFVEDWTKSVSGFSSHYTAEEALDNQENILHVYAFQYLCDNFNEEEFDTAWDRNLGFEIIHRIEDWYKEPAKNAGLSL